MSFDIVPQISTMQFATDDVLEPLRTLVKEQGDIVKELKATGRPELEVKKAVAELKTRKKVLEDKELKLR